MSQEIFHKTVTTVISSSDKSSKATNSNFSVHLPNNILRNDVFGFTVTHVSFQNSMFNISPLNNTLIWAHSPAETFETLVIPPGWYDEEGLLDYITDEINAVIAPEVLNWSYTSEYDERIVWSISNNYQIGFVSGNLLEYIGLGEDGTGGYFTTSYLNPFLCNLAGTQLCHLTSSSLAHNTTVLPSGSHEVIASIHIEIGYRGYESWTNPNQTKPEQIYSERRSVSDIDFQLFDQQFNLVDLGNTHLQIVIKFFV
jgi:hypothetical protein